MRAPRANKQTAMDFYEMMFDNHQPRQAEGRHTGALEKVLRT